MTDPWPIVSTTRQRHVGLPPLLSKVIQARNVERAAARPRRSRAEEAALKAAQEATLDALTTYADALEGLGWPVPRRMQIEIRMHQIACGVSPRRRP